LDLQIKSYGNLKFLRKVWEGWACAGVNEEELTTCAKKKGQEEDFSFFAQGGVRALGR
jgi:hypothetical protein